jgi:predicted RecB family nuclease
VSGPRHTVRGMFLLDGRIILSPTDLRTAAACEFQLLRELDVRLGRIAPLEVEPDGMLTRVAELGDHHEQQELLRLSATHPGAVRQFPRPASTLEALRAADAATMAALADPDVQVICQAAFFDDGFLGFADFLERTDDGWLVSDTKLARSESVPALLQIAAYAAHLTDRGVPVAPVARLVLGSGERQDHALSDILPVYRARRARLERIVAEHHGGSGTPAAWGDERWLACGRCDWCESEVVATNDLLLVAGMRPTTRKRLREAGIDSIQALAASTGEVADVRSARLDALRAQANLQLQQIAAPESGVQSEIVDVEALRRLPRPSPGDIFFDFEGDPLWSERGSHVWGLEYLFGLIENDTGSPQFTAFWAHDRAEEKAALEAFVAHVQARLARWPDLHIYHYAPYETAALTRLAARHSTCEEEIDAFLRAGLFVDLYATVRAGIRVSQRSYSLKKLEPLYMGAREADVKKGDDSIVEYHLAMAAREIGDHATWQAKIAAIGDYNREDCISTMHLRNWLVDQAGGPDAVGATASGDERAVRETTPRRAEQIATEAAVLARVAGIRAGDRTDLDRATAMVAAAVLFHAREDKPFWWRHYDRLRQPADRWQRDGGVGVVEGVPTLVEDWNKPPRARTPRRRYLVDVDPIGGTLLGGGQGKVSALYAVPVDFDLPDDHDDQNAHAKGSGTVTIVEAEEVVAANGRIHQRLLVEENAPGGVETEAWPVAFVPSGTIATTSIDAAIEEIAAEVVAQPPGVLPERAGIDILLRRAPRLRTDAPLPPVGAGDERFIDAITAALLGMDDSYVAVQGPPGTGKTYVGARVIARLVNDHGWRVGVSAQSHAAVENVLDAVVAAGVAPGAVAKVAKETADPAWTSLPTADALAGFLAEHRNAGRGCVVGGTAWDLTNLKRVQRGELDLVVIDEAGQFSLAKTLAVSMAGQRLLLLGDPAQLPQVTQGTHGEPIDESALGWLAEGSAVLPPQRGYFLETTWRMHPALTRAVSTLAYAGQLTSQESVTAGRALEGVEPGLHVRLVDHQENSHHSEEEALEVVALVQDLLGRSWHDPQETVLEESTGRHVPGGPRPLREADIIVITPYNAQVGQIRAALTRAGLEDVRVGTVDKFQGQEAAVAIVSMAASAHADVSRGIGFLLDRNRLNVAISRGQHSAFLVRSRVLTDFAPGSARELVALGAFIGLCDHAHSAQG